MTDSTWEICTKQKSIQYMIHESSPNELIGLQEILEQLRLQEQCEETTSIYSNQVEDSKPPDYPRVPRLVRARAKTACQLIYLNNYKLRNFFSVKELEKM